MTFRHSLGLAMAGFLTLSSLPARPSVLGVVISAKRAHLNTSAVTTGATVYDGDWFSTETGGMLQLRSGMATLELAGESAAGVRNPPNGAQGVEVELGKGTLVFSTARGVSLNVTALKASIRAATDIRTFTRITVTGTKELRICASRGALHFSYRGETETIAEGKCYRVILDPPDDTPNEKKPALPTRASKAFKIVIVSEGAAVIALGIYELREPESPDRP